MFGKIEMLKRHAILLHNYLIRAANGRIIMRNVQSLNVAKIHHTLAKVQNPCSTKNVFVIFKNKKNFHFKTGFGRSLGASDSSVWPPTLCTESNDASIFPELDPIRGPQKKFCVKNGHVRHVSGGLTCRHGTGTSKKYVKKNFHQIFE